MASLVPSILPREPYTQVIIAGASIALLLTFVFLLTNKGSRGYKDNTESDTLTSYLRFVYGCFLKPHTGDTGNGQQDALESFYKAQAGIYDATRKRLLCGREEMLSLVAAQLLYKAKQNGDGFAKCIWVDIGGGTGWNIEAMQRYVPVPDLFSSVYLVDFSPSLCEVARKRFKRLGWNNVKVVCQDARTFRLEDHEGKQSTSISDAGFTRSASYFDRDENSVGGADLLTMSYSLSMIPDFYSVIDSVTTLLAPTGIIGVVDFYVQSIVDLSCRNYTGGVINRHVNWFGRLFWRAWFDVDRVGLEAGRRDYLEYRFGTVLSADERNYLLGAIPYYMWVGRPKKPSSTISSNAQEIVERLDAAVTESPYLSPVLHTQTLSKQVNETAPELRSKAFDAAIINLCADLPLPSFFYQNHHWRVYYDDQLKKHTQFKNEYIYAFTWEDSRVDQRLLNLGSNDVVLAITSAGDNILSYALSSPARIHAVDLNPSQNHLLELKVAAYNSLAYVDFWKIFGEGKHPDFRVLLMSKLSPHLSSRAFQYWLDNCKVFTSAHGLYETGGSRHSIRILRLLFATLGLCSQVKAMLDAKTLNDQRTIWNKSLRPVILSKIMCYLVVSHESFLWAALGVPHNQVVMLEADHQAAHPGATRGQAIWAYMVNTLDPLLAYTLVGEDNSYYQICLAGTYTPKCHPAFLAQKAYTKLSRPGALDNLRIHTDELKEVFARLSPATLSVAVVMDSMDWFDPGADEAANQIVQLNRALRIGGRVLLRSAGLSPWYIMEFESRGFVGKRVGERVPGKCIDRVNMYASCWILTKVEAFEEAKRGADQRGGSIDLDEIVL